MLSLRDMSYTCKGNTNNIFAILAVLLFVIITHHNYAASLSSNFFHTKLTGLVDSPPPSKRLVNPILIPSSTVIIDSPPVRTAVKGDTVFKTVADTFSFKMSKDSLDAPVVYHADDSMVLQVPEKKMILYGKVSTVKYADNDLSAPEIVYDQKTNLVKAYLKKDSTGKVISFVSFNQGDFKSVMDSITFNMSTQKGITKGTYTQQGEMYVYGERIKKINPDVFYALNSRFTTCNLDTPHFAFVSKKIKFINQKMAFSGPVHPEFEGVPVPIILPFGIYPLQQGRHSGILSPNFTTNSSYGIGLENFGYYKVFSDYWDVEARASVFSYGGYNATLRPRYYKRYKYQGNFSLNYLRNKALDTKATNNYNFTWSHSLDNKSRPGVSFRANVNAGSSQYNSFLPNSPITNFSNRLSSTIIYGKVWQDKPYNMTINANHEQNSITGLYNVNLPDVTFNVNTQYPFRRKENVGELKWYENIGIGLNSAVRNRTSFYDSMNVLKQALDNLQYGAEHQVPITLSLPPLGVLQVAPSVSYSERWFQRKSLQRWNDNTRKIDTTNFNGLYTARNMSFGVGVTTRIFGIFGFKKSSKVQAIRHEIRPSISANYSPDLSKNTLRMVQVDSPGTRRAYSIYDNNLLYGPFGSGTFGGLSFSLDNNISMKVRNKKDTAEGATKKINLIDGLRLGTSYNFVADSFRLSNISLSARSSLFDKINITADATFDPYQTNDQGQRIDKFTFAKNPFSLGNLVSGGIQVQSSFQGGKGKSKNSPLPDYNQQARASGIQLDEYQQEAAYIQQNPGEFADFSIPWDISVGYSLSLSRFRQPGTPIFKSNLTQNTNINASVNLTPKWKIGAQGSYDISAGQIGVISSYLSRDMHCWQMSLNVSPVGRYRFFSISINPKSAILRDLKVNRTRSFNNF